MAARAQLVKLVAADPVSLWRTVLLATVAQQRTIAVTARGDAQRRAEAPTRAPGYLDPHRNAPIGA